MACTQKSSYIWEDNGRFFIDSNCTEEITQEAIKEELDLPYMEREVTIAGKKVKPIHILLFILVGIVVVYFISKK